MSDRLTAASTAGIAYQPGQWHDLFAASAGAAATLGGLLFVAVSLNLEHVLKTPTLPPLAARSLTGLLGLLLMSLLCLAPAQSAASLGADITVLGVAIMVVVMASALRTHLPVTRWSWTVQTIVLALVSTVPTVTAGVTLMLGAGGGLHWAVLELVCGFSVAIYAAWVLLIEIRR